MKAAELKKLSVEELNAKLEETRKELFDLRFKHATAQLDNTSGIPATKRAIARIMTILKEKGA
ncbi:50S ribosomal protein L29 [Halodesulfovibrio sp. MK-HDV]|jgi:large subunit ribosomal protein L29|uniref:50S ribosomal protein L29 n=1 Tax=unclassified Halodesulfovibrio TaxID=2644657 RepID=UPI0013719ABD|nr:50S ribosomal protein L29 [Halodesulfovibrio sp. MK-HDV]KAF1074621.1 50S ribosomal protein L29 [Halodesulfovibrio sp. MK-HDV]